MSDDLAITWLKSAHIIGIAVWVAGLFYLPAILRAHAKVENEYELVRIRRSSRFAFTAVVSPAAIIAIGAGAALLLFGDALYGWMFVKFLFVFLLAIAHLQFGSLLRRYESDDHAPSRTLVAGLVALTAGSSVVVLWLVLAEPFVPFSWLPDWMLRPGGLSEFLNVPTPI